MSSITRQARKLYGAGSHLLARAAGVDEQADADARSPAAQSAAMTGIPVAFKHVEQAVERALQTLPGGGMTVSKARIRELTSICHEFERRVQNQPLEMRASLADLAHSMMMLHAASMQELHSEYQKPYAQVWEKHRAAWRDQVSRDPEFGRQRETVLSKLRKMLDAYGRDRGPERLQTLRQLFAVTGVGDHLEFLRWVAWLEPRVSATINNRAGLPRSGGAVQAGGRR